MKELEGNESLVCMCTELFLKKEGRDKRQVMSLDCIHTTVYSLFLFFIYSTVSCFMFSPFSIFTWQFILFPQHSPNLD